MKKLRKKVMKIVSSVMASITGFCSMCVSALAANDVEWIKEGSDDGGTFSSLLAKIKGLGQDAYSLMIVIGAAVAVICIVALGISFMVVKQAQKRDENKTWLVYVFLGGVIVSGGVTIAGIIMKIGAGL